jgi:hypothetical protein
MRNEQADRQASGDGHASLERNSVVRLSREREIPMKPIHFPLALVIALPCAAFAAGGGGTGGAAGGASAGSARGSATGTSSIATPNTAPAGIGSPAVSGALSGPAQTGGLNSSVNDPSGGVLNANKAPSPGTIGLAPSRPVDPSANPDGTVREPPPGTNSLGAAGTSGGVSASGTAGTRSNRPPPKNKQATPR